MFINAENSSSAYTVINWR